ncbi:MAG: biotin carboxylase N-terminal domain-containing protein [Sphingomonadales bacterium]
MAGFKRVLIANRGEIAVRIARTAHSMGFETVAVYSEADASSPHVEACGRAVCLGPALPAESYLSINRVIGAARQAGADAIHPGYGFLAENAALAEACDQAGIVFIGPSPEAIRVMGNKRAAKARADGAGVPVIPGYRGEDQSDERLAREAATMGVPLMIKAAAGGGGRGLRLVEHMADVKPALQAARSEAVSGFGDDELILEKLIVGARHIEVQVFGDRHGNVVHLFERDCSIQRRHQKVIEEAPSPALDDELRKRMGAAACAAAKAIGYEGAGTVEFLLDSESRFYFLEMNTRLQVEHPVTERVTGLDLVEWQFRVALAEPLPLAQDEIELSGHAIEARLYAEDPDSDFLPQSGTLCLWRPCAGTGARTDHALRGGLEISPFYDPMIAKVVACGQSREDARRKLVQALERTVALGVRTNKQFLIKVLEQQEFIEGRAATDFIDRHGDALTNAGAEIANPVWALAAALISTRIAHTGGWRLTGEAPSWLLELASGEAVVAADVAAREGGYVISCGEDVFVLEFEGQKPADGILRFSLDGVAQTAAFVFAGPVLHLEYADRALSFRQAEVGNSKAEEDGGNVLAAPMAGRIVEIRTEQGAAVTAGQTLAVLEAMKMQHEVRAGRDGVVETVHVGPGHQVSDRQTLVTLTQPTSQALQGEAGE